MLGPTLKGRDRPKCSGFSVFRVWTQGARDTVGKVKGTEKTIGSAPLNKALRYEKSGSKESENLLLRSAAM